VFLGDFRRKLAHPRARGRAKTARGDVTLPLAPFKQGALRADAALRPGNPPGSMIEPPPPIMDHRRPPCHFAPPMLAAPMPSGMRSMPRGPPIAFATLIRSPRTFGALRAA